MLDIDCLICFVFCQDYLASSESGSDGGGEAITIDDIELPKQLRDNNENTKKNVWNKQNSVAEYRKMLLGELDESFMMEKRNVTNSDKVKKMEETTEFEFAVELSGDENEFDNEKGVWEQRLDKQKRKRKEGRRERTAELKRQKEEETSMLEANEKKNRQHSVSAKYLLVINCITNLFFVSAVSFDCNI